MYYDKESFDELKCFIVETISFFKRDGGKVFWAFVLVLLIIFSSSFCGCSNKNLIDLDSCTSDKLLDCVSSHRIETSIEAINLVIACQKDMCLRSAPECPKIQRTNCVIIVE